MTIHEPKIELTCENWEFCGEERWLEMSCYAGGYTLEGDDLRKAGEAEDWVYVDESTHYCSEECQKSGRL